MSMTGSQDEEDPTSEPEKLTNEASKATVSLKPFSLDLNRCLSPMLGLLGSKELVPSILEYEKVMLVVKEHSYAKEPDRADVLQLSNIHSKDLSTQEEDANSLLNARTDLLQLRRSIGHERSEPSVVCHLRQVVGLQVALIREQQEQLHDKDREMNAVKKEKEQVRFHNMFLSSNNCYVRDNLFRGGGLVINSHIIINGMFIREYRFPLLLCSSRLVWNEWSADLPSSKNTPD